MFAPKTAVHTTREQKEWWAILACLCSSFAFYKLTIYKADQLVSWTQYTLIQIQNPNPKRKGKVEKEGKPSEE